MLKSGENGWCAGTLRHISGNNVVLDNRGMVHPDTDFTVEEKLDESSVDVNVGRGRINGLAPFLTRISCE